MIEDRYYKKQGDVIHSEEWNGIIDELKALRTYIDGMAARVTLTALPSPVGTFSTLHTGASRDYDYGIDVLGLISGQYFCRDNGTAEICRFGIADRAGVFYYWAGASGGEESALEVTIEYLDGTRFTGESRYVHDWSRLMPRGTKNPYLEYLQSHLRRYWYKYAIANPDPAREIRWLGFRDASEQGTVRIANVLQYERQVRPIHG